MNNNDMPSDDLLQFIFGELTDTREAAVRKAVAEDAELAASVRGLEAAVAAVRAENVGEVGEQFNDRLRRRTLELLDPAQPDTTRPTFLTRSLITWRWIMHSPVSRATAAAIFVLAVTGVALWFHAGGTTPAYADFVKPLLEAKTARFKITTETMGVDGGKNTTVVMRLGPSRMRSESDIGETPNNPKSKSVIIWDGYQGKTLQLDPKLKLATVCDDVDRLKDKTPKVADILGGWGSFFLDIQKPDVKHEPLGEKDIDGRHVIGFRITTLGGVIEVWGDPKTGMPVRIDQTMALMHNLKVKITVSDFELNVDLDESLFSVEPPAGYKVTIVRQTNDGPPGERSLIETFQWYGFFSDGELPDSLDLRKIEAFYDQKSYRELIWDICTPLSGNLDEKKRRKIEEFLQNITVWEKEYDSEEKKPNKEEKAKYEEQGEKFEEELYNLVDWDKIAPGKKNLTREQKEQYEQAYTEKFMNECPMAGNIGGTGENQGGVFFANGLPPEADAHYAGKGVKLGAADRPIFWYRPKDSKKYRVIYADLSVRDADTPPSVPNAQPVPGPSSPKK
ncbi:MAG: hypothetical protein ABSA26_01615 [Thermoguttaceae bacterium]|jgi:outer membrane lipoprotein-sorting protein